MLIPSEAPEARVTLIMPATGPLPGLGGIAAIWGGSVAFTRAALDALDLPRILARADTEDALIGLEADALGLRVVTRRGLRLPTPLSGSLLSLWRFARRQYQFVRL